MDRIEPKWTKKTEQTKVDGMDRIERMWTERTELDRSGQNMTNVDRKGPM